ncbi:MAG: hypothetical protein K0S58_2598 [Nitrospira sp.]|nr:hypothetical protein [Nitrospira sp.]
MRRKDGSLCSELLASLCFIALWFLSISSCGHGRNGLPELSKESLTFTQQAGNRALSAEGRLRIAQELFQHRRAYEPIIRHPSAAAGDRQTARTLQRSDADTAGATMHTIAEDYLVNGETDKARAVYYSILTLFADEEYASIRKAAEDRLQGLDEKEQRKKMLR